MRPQLAVGGGKPTCRYDSTLSAMIIWATDALAITISGPATFGRMCLIRMRQVSWPSARDATMKSKERVWMVLLRMMRAVPNQLVRPSTSRIVRMLVSPRAAPIAITSSRYGKLRPTSTSRISAVSSACARVDSA